MKAFNLSRYFKRWLPLILVVCIAATGLTYFTLSRSQKYAASAVIEYTSVDARLGITPSGDPLDVNELKSASVIAKVINRMGLEGSYSADKLISGINIYPVVDQEEEATKEAKRELGEEYISEPIRYVVTFTDKDASFARRVLDEVLDVYFAEYSEKYVNRSTVSNRLNKIYNDHYDYIELMELIEGDVVSATDVLYGRLESAPYFRSTKTGLSFQDLVYEFEYLMDVHVMEIFSDIYSYQITRDKSVLFAKYQSRIDENNIIQSVEASHLVDVEHLIDTYAKHMIESGNVDFTYEYILDEVYEPEHQDSKGVTLGSGEQTVTYDKLIEAWRDHKQDQDYAAIDTAYCNWVIQSFSACQEGCDGSCQQTNQTCSALNNPKYAEAEARVNEQIRQLVDNLNHLYTLSAETNAEYNEYLGASNIAVLSSVSVQASVNVKLYTLIVAVLLLIVGCGVAVLLGRMDDILSYMFHTDHMTGFGNRAAVDSYLKKHESKMLDDDMACMMVTVKNQPQINQELGRKDGDALLVYVSNALKEAFSGYKAEFFYNGNACFIVFCEQMNAEELQNCIRRITLIIDRRDVVTESAVEYEIGASESEQQNARNVRELLSKAYEVRSSYVSSAQTQNQE